MKFTKFTLIFFLIFSIGIPSLKSQTNEDIIKEIVGEIKRDSIIRYLEDLTGEREVLIDGQQYRIQSRHRQSTGNDLTARYLRQKLSQFGYDPKLYLAKQIYYIDSTEYYLVENVEAFKKGTSDEEKLIVVTAHYDSESKHYYGLDSMELAPGADDNGSGTAAMLEIARVLQNYQNKYNILFAFVDDEEKTMFGSKIIADSLFNLGMKDVTCINLDMMGYSKTDDYLTYVYYDSDIEGNENLGDLSVSVSNILNLKTKVTPSDTFYISETYQKKIHYGLSDALAFGLNGYPAINIMENSKIGERNNCYHDTCDKIDNMNLDYYFENVQLAASVISILSEVSIQTGVTEDTDLFLVGEGYPNPANEMIYFDVNFFNDDFDIDLHNASGILIRSFKTNKQNRVIIDLTKLNLPNGVYFCRFTMSSGRIIIRKISLIK